MAEGNKYDKLEQFLKGALDKLDEVPGDSVWEGIESELHPQASSIGFWSNGKARRTLAYFAAAVLALLFWWKIGSNEGKVEQQFALISEELSNQQTENAQLNEKLIALEALLQTQSSENNHLIEEQNIYVQDALSLGQEIKRLKNQQTIERQKAQRFYNEISGYKNNERLFNEKVAAQNEKLIALESTIARLQENLNASIASLPQVGETDGQDANDGIVKVEEDDQPFIPIRPDHSPKSDRLFLNGSNQFGVATSAAQGVTDLGLGALNYSAGLKYKRNFGDHLSASLGLSYWTQDYDVTVSEVEYNTLENTESFAENDLLNSQIGRVSQISKKSNTILFPLMVEYNFGRPNKKLNYFLGGGWAPYVYIKEDFQLSYVPDHGARTDAPVQDRYFERSLNYSEGSIRTEAGINLNLDKTQFQFVLFNDLGVLPQGVDQRRISQFGLSANWYFFNF